MLLIAFFSGIFLDVFLGTIGILSFCSVLIVYLRIILEPLFIEDFDLNKNIFIHIQSLGLRKYLLYVLFLSFIYHTAFYLLVFIPISNFSLLLEKSLISFSISAAIVFILDYLFFYTQKQNN